MTQDELKLFRVENKNIEKDISLKALIIGSTVGAVVLLIAPIIKEYSFFFGLTSGAITAYLVYTTAISKIQLENLIGKNKTNKEVANED